MIQRVKTSDGLELQGILYRPSKKSEMVVLHCHGMAGNFYENRFVDMVGKLLVSEGIAFCAMNNRGHDFIADFIVEQGDKREYKRVGQIFERIEDSVKDIEAWVEFLAKEGFKAIFIMGHSLGAVKSVLYAKDNQKNLSGLILLSPPDMMGLAKKEKDFQQKMTQSKKLLEAGKKDQIIEGMVFDNYPISAGTYVNFFSDGSKVDMFPISKKGDPKELSSIKLPLKIVFGEKDDCFDYDPIGIRSFFSMHVPDASLTVIPLANHVYLGQERLLAQEILGFVKINEPFIL